MPMLKNVYEKFIKENLNLQEHLAVHRTLLANERTLLAYLRTALAFFITGATLIRFFQTPISILSGLILVSFGIVLFSIGAVRYHHMKYQILILEKDSPSPEKNLDTEMDD